VTYSTVVADPPWDYATDTRRTFTERGGDQAELEQPYATLTVEELAAVPLQTLAAKHAHLYLWTTQRYLRDAHWIVEAWGFRFVKLLVWCKAPRGFMLGGTYQSCTEFVLFARRGKLPARRQVNRDWFEWPRPGNQHSAKPGAFFDLVESVSPGPYLELFARTQRLGWDSYGDECLQHVDASPTVVAV